MASIKEALKYPFANFARLFNYWWILVPVWGWLVASGYGLRVYEEIIKGKDKELPAIRPFTGLFKEGFFLIVVMLVLQIAVFIIALIPLLGWVGNVYYILIAPVLVAQIAVTKKIGDGLNVVDASKVVFNNFGEWIITFLKSLVVVLIWLIASIPIITMVVTIPAISWSQSYLWANYYREATKK
ncbi:DUF4013 domain-containing protein [Candidatus Woesearchaeota archaeon]|jgi:hypothetical protein|nr:DUF4013 domain-containing protein [Candidatus Woesearchaeota archaeon]MBT4151237.1 DUF4013 domain-containing protein [Candidatus Woesearchaeota archaeon]MBT4247290.1 DUF4013 domain-containing protein [Candidatus Woesearchaeota archaeon]MBT4434003.1 DUF4013 domain-containing protein [Candidatus Woesearchaeota archaeon]MBT7332400.1 DUF4013 domain-containing protein [Candidatus Woesearchaeota archaeon]